MASRVILSNRSSKAIFLMYHSIADEGPEVLSVPPDTFERQLAHLRREGFRSGTTSDLADIRAGRRLDARRVFLTFDDGFADNHSAAMPLMAEYGFTGLIFLLPRLVDSAAPLRWPEVADWVEQYPETMRSMDWNMVGEMIEAGHEFGSHTLSHPRLDRIGAEQLREELLDSRKAIIERLGSCSTVAYPFGDWDEDVRQAAADAGYDHGFIVSPLAMRGADPLAIPRAPIDRRDDERHFRAKLSVLVRSMYLSPWSKAIRPLIGTWR